MKIRLVHMKIVTNGMAVRMRRLKFPPIMESAAQAK
jgi:hypothetical protein